MKTAALPLSIVLVLAAAAPVAAQEEVAAEPISVCARLSSADPAADLSDPTELGRGLLDGEVTVELVEADACGLDEADAGAPGPASGTTPFVDFVAQGAGAAIELAALAERHEGADTLPRIDRAARSLAAWAKTQRKWLDRHPPEACYADVHAQWRDGVVQVRDGAKSVRKAVRTLTPAPMRMAVRQLAAGTDKLVDIDFDAVMEACRAAE